MRPIRCSIAALILIAAAGAKPIAAATLRVPADHPSIAAGLDAAASGDTVLVACGIYHVHDLQLPNVITLMSEAGDPDCVVIDDLGESVFYVMWMEGNSPEALVRGITFRGGSSSTYRGAFYCNEAQPRFERCRFTGSPGNGFYCLSTYGCGRPDFLDCEFTDNAANGFVAEGIEFVQTRPTFTDCRFSGNGGHGLVLNACSPDLVGCEIADNAGRGIQAALSHLWARDCTIAGNGGGLYSTGGSPWFETCRFLDNVAAQGGGAYCDAGYMLYLPRFLACVFSGNDADQGAAIYCLGGDWTACIAGQGGQDGNLFLDPQFCGVAGSGNYLLQADSPCAPLGIGAPPVGCEISAAATASWSRIKSLY